MANNQNINKVVYDGTTLIDLTQDDVNRGDVLNGKSFHLADGSRTTGTATIPMTTFFATCTTLADEKDKTATLTDSTGWELKPGTIVGVKFTNTNTYASTAEAPVTLNVNSTGAKPIYYNNAVSPTGAQTAIYGYANRIIYYMYDGTNWCWLGDGRHDGNSDTKVRQTLSSSNANYPLLMSYGNNANTNTNIDNLAYRNNSIYANPSTGNIQATKLNGVTIGSSPKFTDTTYESKVATSGGTEVSLVTTGEKYNWNNKIFPTWRYTGTVNLTITNGTLTAGSLKYCLNDDKTIGMFWGQLVIKGGGAFVASFDTNVASQAAQRTIYGLIIHNGGYSANNTQPYLLIDTNGNVSINASMGTNNIIYNIPPVIMRFSDF